MTGIGTMFPMKPFSVPPESLMILPEVKDKKLWYKGDINFIDKERLILVFIAYLDQGIHVNTDIVKPGEIKSMQDLLSPKWKGKIVIDDPLVIGRGQTFMEHTVIRLGEDYVTQLVKQEPISTRDVRQVAEFVARGRYPIGLGVRPDPYQEFKRAGAPITNIFLDEVANLASGIGNIVAMDKAPNPNASRVFLNWLLSRKGQAIWQEIRMDQSARNDVSVDNLVKAGLPVRKEGVDYFDVRSERYQTGEEALKARTFVIKAFSSLLR
jgi:ABC-type Fe3+ transport system substrate-binding protein